LIYQNNIHKPEHFQVLDGIIRFYMLRDLHIKGDLSKFEYIYKPLTPKTIEAKANN